jgi:hypothetical protein
LVVSLVLVYYTYTVKYLPQCSHTASAAVDVESALKLHVKKVFIDSATSPASSNSGQEDKTTNFT